MHLKQSLVPPEPISQLLCWTLFKPSPSLVIGQADSSLGRHTQSKSSSDIPAPTMEVGDLGCPRRLWSLSGWLFPRTVLTQGFLCYGVMQRPEGNKGYGTGTQSEQSRELGCGQESRLSQRVPRLELALPVRGSEVSLDYEPVHMFTYRTQNGKVGVCCGLPSPRTSCLTLQGMFASLWVRVLSAGPRSWDPAGVTVKLGSAWHQEEALGGDLAGAGRLVALNVTRMLGTYLEGAPPPTARVPGSEKGNHFRVTSSKAVAGSITVP